MEARPSPHPLALPPLPHQLPRPDQHRKCQIGPLGEYPAYHRGPIQRRSLYLLRLLLARRALDQCPAEEAKAQHLNP